MKAEYRTSLNRHLSLAEAAYLAGKSPETIKRWCKVHKIGQQLASFYPWRVDPIGLAIVIAGDARALNDYRAGSMESPSVAPYRGGAS